MPEQVQGEAADDFEVPVPRRSAQPTAPPAVPPAPPTPPPPAPPEPETEEVEEPEAPKAPDKAAQDVVTPVLTAQNMADVFRAQEKHARAVRLGELMKTHPEVLELVQRNADLEEQIKKLTAKKAK
jgi:hypothetical protein